MTFAQKHVGPIKSSVSLLILVLLAPLFSSLFIAPAAAQTNQAECDVQYGTGKTKYEETPDIDGRMQGGCRTVGSSITAGIDKNSPASTGASGCTWYNWFVQPIKCIFIPVVSFIGSLFLFIGGFILSIAAALFNILVKWIIVEFGSTVQALGIIDGIHIGWEVLRDLANIVIIGMFTFIAISMILGSETFGQKKMVARVLIIAVLINFSLLFSKMIIDASNFTAYQIYKAMGATSGPNSNLDISGRFFAIVGMVTVWDSFKVTQEFAGRAQSAGEVAAGNTVGNNITAGIKGFLYGLAGGTMLLTAAFVIFYGCYLIAVRAVLLVFLMLTSALAFGTYLVPKLSDSGYGWQTWWKSLINAAVFGPLLMIMLYISLVVLSRVPATTGSIGNSLADPANMDWQVIIVFIFGIGMLYVSFRVASTFSHSISGFGMASAATMTPFAGMSRFLGFMGRQTLGRGGEYAYRKMGDSGFVDDKSGMFKRGTMRMMQSLATSKFDPLASNMLKDVVKKAGAPAMLEGAGKGGFTGVKKRQAENAAELGRTLQPTEEGTKKIIRRDEIRANAAEEAALAREEAELELNRAASNNPKLLAKKQGDGEAREVAETEVHGKVVTPGIKKDSAVQRDEMGAIKPTDAQNRSAVGESALSESTARAREAAREAQQRGYEEAHAGMSPVERLGKMNEDAVQSVLKDIRTRLTELRDVNKRELEVQKKLEPAAVKKRQHEILEKLTKKIAAGRPSAAFGALPIDRGAMDKQVGKIIKSHEKEENLKALAGVLPKTDEKGH